MSHLKGIELSPAFVSGYIELGGKVLKWKSSNWLLKSQFPSLSREGRSGHNQHGVSRQWDRPH
jgi:hypothetical protein